MFLLKILLSGAVLLLIHLLVKFIIKPYLLLLPYRSKGIKTFFYPIIGAEYFTIRDTAKKGDCYHYIKQLAKENPKLKGYAAPFSSTIAVFLTDPVYIKEFINNKAQKYYTKDSEYFKLFNYTSNEVGLVFAEGENWKSQRKSVSESFHFEYMRSLLPTIVKTAAEVLAKCKQISGENSQVIALSAIKNFQKVSGDIICRMFFGNAVMDCVIEGKSFTELMAEHIEACSVNTLSLTNLLLGWRFFSLGLRASDRKFIRGARLIDKTITVLVKDQISQLKENPSSFDSKILLHRLLQKYEGEKSDHLIEQLKIQFATLFAAGMDTTGHLVSMACYFMITHGYQDKLRDEIAQHIKCEDDIIYENLEKLEFMNLFIKETLRLGSPSQRVFLRAAVEDNNILDLKIKKGTFVEFSLGFNFANPANFPEPERFDPLRWKGLVLKDPFIYAPFSAGPRNCIGQHLALMETKAILAYLLLKYEMSVKSDYVLRMHQGLLYAPVEDIPLLLKPITSK
mmetsp:Transcript_10271/g.11675  ORF Transcript_10271/g.11675 Transcript_10271/m.11675 type:complete len:510 (+) Transcript_10271:56-1585(+)